MDLDVVKRVLAALESHRVRYAIFGAMALNLHGLVRLTQDLDLFVAPERDNIDRLKQALLEALQDPEMMKKDTVRPKDRIDAAWLRERFNLEEK